MVRAVFLEPLMQRVYSSQDAALTVYLKGLLETEGIACTLRNALLGGAAGELPVHETWPELWVMHDADAERARAIVAAASAPPVGSPWTCPSCAESIEGQFDQCWQCGAARPE
jgi:hypothetical protein